MTELDEAFEAALEQATSVGEVNRLLTLKATLAPHNQETSTGEMVLVPRETLIEARKGVKLLEDLCACHGDDDYVRDLLAKLDAVIAAAPTPSPQTSPATGGEVVAWEYGHLQVVEGRLTEVKTLSHAKPTHAGIINARPLFSTPPPAKAGEGEAGLTEAFTALDLADSLIERAYGVDVPKEWNTAYRNVAKARARTP